MPIKDMLETTIAMEIKEFRVTQDLRDEIKQLRMLIAAIVKQQGGIFCVSYRALQSVHTQDTFTQRTNDSNDTVILEYVPCPYPKKELEDGD